MSRRALDLAGQRFGRLVAVEPTDHRRGSSVVWLCRCDCGAEALAPSDRLRSGLTSACRLCARKASVAAMRAHWDRVAASRPPRPPKPPQGHRASVPRLQPGDRFGKLRVLFQTEKRVAREKLWLCECDCGTAKLARAGDLRRHRIVHCGCSPRPKGGGAHLHRLSA